MIDPEKEISRWRSVWRQAPLLVALVALWLFLWDDVTVLSVATGIGLAIAVARIFYLPPVLLSGRFNPWRALILGLRMMFDITVASFQVAWKSINPAYHPLNSLIAVDLHTHSDLVMTLTAEAVSVIPGTVVVDVDRDGGVLYLHALSTPTLKDVEIARERALHTEERIVLAVGTREEAELVRSERRARREKARQSRRTNRSKRGGQQ